jgi:S1-C subfamily serine protease
MDPERDPLRLLSRSFEEAARAVVPKVVSIACLGPEGSSDGGGSGIIVDPSGLVVTNYHVVSLGLEAGHGIVCTLHNGDVLPVKRVVGQDVDADIAVLDLGQHGLPAATLGDSDSVRVGQWVLCIGNAEGLAGTVTHGIVSAVGRRGIVERFLTPDDLIQTDAPINRGNSGGALVDLDGRVIGLSTLIYSPTGASIGLGFALPINVVQRALHDILTTGTVARARLGVWEDSSRTPTRAGALVGRVVLGSPAFKAGLEPGDLIVAYNGFEIPSFDRLRQLVAYTKPGAASRLTVLRGGDWTSQLVLEAVVDEREVEPPAERIEE